jgi:hypothetical protein
MNLESLAATRQIGISLSASHPRKKQTCQLNNIDYGAASG